MLFQIVVQYITILSIVILIILSLNTSSSLSTASSNNEERDDISNYIPININDGPSNLHEGKRLFQQQKYNDASAYLWRAVLLHTSQTTSFSSSSNDGSDNKYYNVDEVFTQFLQCYLQQNKVVNGLIFIAAESYMRKQDEMGDLYLKQALDRSGSEEDVNALALKDIIERRRNHGEEELFFSRLKEIRDTVDISNPKNQLKENNMEKDDDDDDFWSQFTATQDKETTSPQETASANDININDKTPEELYNIATQYFNTKQLQTAQHLFQLSCTKSQMKLYVACTNAIYLRTNLCDWGYNGTRFNNDMKIIEEITLAEVEMYRTVTFDDITEDMKRLNGLGYAKKKNDKNEEGIIHWTRGTSVHPHMMLGYPLSNDNAILKRYVSESQASLDELRARVYDDGSGIMQRPMDLPYSVLEMRDKFVKKNLQHQQQQKQQLSENNDVSTSSSSRPIKVGFVACSFNSKAVLYLSHDMFRFFDPSVVEIHVFSTGPPDHPSFIHHVMRDVDWRQRVIDTVDYFHDVREYQNDHIGLARYIYNLEIQILIEWDGYARQGERAAGLLALRPAPIQILHQEFLMTSGAQYFDYIVTDEIVSPLRLEGLYTEKFLYLPNHFFSKGHAVQREVRPPTLEYVSREKGAPFQLGVGTPQENACLKDDDGNTEVSFVYCNFNKFLKNNPETMKSWIRVLEEVPNSILCLLENPKEGVSNLRKFVSEVTNNNVDNNFDGPDLNDRIHFLEWEKNPYDHQQRSHSLCNVMLDSFPYNGHTTAQDALYAGVPIVTRSDGDDMSSRVSTSANAVLGLEELNANNGSTEYENIAIRLGTDASWFNSIRTKLINTCLQKNPMHPYWDVPRYVENFQLGLEIIWNNFLDGKDIDHVHVIEKGEEEGTRGTFEVDLLAKERIRNDMKRVQHINDEL